MTRKPLCFVIMPFGQKADSSGRLIDFDRVYQEFHDPAIRAAGLEPLRADQETVGGIIHKPMFERLVLCEYAIADVTIPNPNVYYELGVRHGTRPWSTILTFAQGTSLPFDLKPVRSLPYSCSASGGTTGWAASTAKLTELLNVARTRNTDSPVFQLVDGFPAPEIAHIKTDVFRDRWEYSQKSRRELAQARDSGISAIRGFEANLGSLEDEEVGVLVDLLLSYRALSAWKDMINLVERVPEHLRLTAMVREQYGLALNRDKRRGEATRVLEELIAERGPTSESCGILGRVYKDQRDDALGRGDVHLAEGFLRKAVATYKQGFESDWRDAYPGINAVTLMELMNPPDPSRHELLPVVRYSVRRRMAAGKPDYWDYATMLELEVLGSNQDLARAALADALAHASESWMAVTTSNNLRLIREARTARGEHQPWIEEIEKQLMRAGTSNSSTTPNKT